MVNFQRDQIAKNVNHDPNLCHATQGGQGK